jgi:hypothetical protein
MAAAIAVASRQERERERNSERASERESNSETEQASEGVSEREPLGEGHGRAGTSTVVVSHSLPRTGRFGPNVPDCQEQTRSLMALTHGGLHGRGAWADCWPIYRLRH